MPEEIFIIIIISVMGGLFLGFVSMILTFLKDRRKSTGGSLGASELEEMIRRSVELGSASLHERINDLEDRLESVDDKLEALPKALPAAQSKLSLDDFSKPEAVEMQESGRSGRRRKV